MAHKPLIWKLVAVLFSALWLASCSSHVSIADLTRDPAQYAGKDVTITGQAGNMFGGFGNGLFEIDDGTGRIWVMTENFGLPPSGARVSITGQVQQGISIGGRNFGLLFRQTKARD